MLSGWLSLGSETKMNGRTKHTQRLRLTLLNLMALNLFSGCNLLGIPSYRAHETSCSTACTPGPLPPLPGCLAKWQAEKELPVAPEYPRFHPLPTRPMFAPQATEHPH